MALAALAALFVAIPALLFRDVWAVDEPRYARVAMEMAERGDFLLPRLHGAVYADKPPLLFWLANIVAPLTTWWNGLPIRLVSLGFGAATVALTARLASRFAPGRAGLLSGLVLAAAPLELAIAQAGMFDTALAFAVTLAWSALAPPPTSRAGAVFGLALGLGILAKGPMALLLTVPGAALFRLGGAQRGRRLAALRPGRFAAAAAAAAVLVAGAWFVPAAIAGGRAYVEETLFRQTLGRAAAGWAHARPVWFYAAMLPLAAFPFAFALPEAVRGLPRKDPLARLALAWLGSGFVLLSLVSGKQVHYLAPLLPPLAILVGRSLAERDLSPRAHAAAAAAVGLAAAALLFGPALLGSFGALDALEADRRRAVAALAPAGAALALVPLALRAAHAAGLAPPRAALAFAAPLVLSLALPIAAAREWNAIGCGRAFGGAIRAHVARAESLALYRVGKNGSLSLYSGLGPVPFFHDFDAFKTAVVAPGSRIAFVACRAQDVAAVETHLGRALEVVAEGWNDWDREALCRLR